VTDPRRPHRGTGTRAVRRQHRSRDLPVGCEDPRCDAKRDRWLGEVYPRDSQREFLGLVMVGPHVTDMVEAGAHVLDSEAVH
jgi:hypothetical protein